MADKGFTIDDLLSLCVTPNIPPFLGSNSEMAADDVVKTQEIASLGIHIGHAINKIKNFCNGIRRIGQLSHDATLRIILSTRIAHVTRHLPWSSWRRTF